MAGIKGADAKILIDQWDLSGQSNGISITGDVKQLEYAVLQGLGMNRLPGLPMASIEHNGYFTAPNAGDLEYEMNARLGSNSGIVAAAILGTSLAVPVAYVLNTTFGQQLKIKGQTDQLITVQGNWPAKADKLVRGYQVYFGTLSTTGATPTVDFGAAATGAGSKAWLFVQAITGTATSATVKVQSSTASNFSSPTDRGTFTFSAVGANYLALSGTLDRYVRLNCTSLGGATNFTVLGVVASYGLTF